jgi:hypothetical protein
MITTTLKVEFTEALPSGLHCTMCKTLEMPYALRVGDNICEGDPYSDEAIDLTAESAWYELQTSTLTVICEGTYDLPTGAVEPLRQALFALGWMQQLPIPASLPTSPQPARIGACRKCGEQRQQCSNTECPGKPQAQVFPPACPRCTQRRDQCVCPPMFPSEEPPF